MYRYRVYPFHCQSLSLLAGLNKLQAKLVLTAGSCTTVQHWQLDESPYMLTRLLYRQQQSSWATSNSAPVPQEAGRARPLCASVMPLLLRGLQMQQPFPLLPYPSQMPPYASWVCQLDHLLSQGWQGARLLHPPSCSCAYVSDRMLTLLCAHLPASWQQLLQRALPTGEVLGEEHGRPPGICK